MTLRLEIFLIAKVLVSGTLIVVIGETAKKNNMTASVVHSLPLMSLLALVWLYLDTHDTALIARHMQGTFWFLLPTLPMFLATPWLLRREFGFWPSLAICIVLTIALYLLTMRLLRFFGITL